MTARYAFLALGGDTQLVLDWFAQQPYHVARNNGDHRVAFHFADLGPVVWRNAENGVHGRDVDFDASPIVWITTPRQVRSVLWTSGEVLFTPTPLKTRFPRMERVAMDFTRWLKQFELVHSTRKRPRQNFRSYLEGTLQNWDGDLYALPEALAALQEGQYFVSGNETAETLDRLCRALQARGIPAE